MIIYGVIVFALFLLIAVILLTMKRKRCTVPVDCMITDKRTVYYGKTFQTEGKTTYFYEGKAYPISKILKSKNENTMKLFINPNKPKEWVPAEKSGYYGFMIVSFACAVVIFLCPLVV